MLKLWNTLTLKSKFLMSATLFLSLWTVSSSLAYADSVENLVAGFGINAIKAHYMNAAPTGNDLTIAINNAQATYLLSEGSPMCESLTQQLLLQLTRLNPKGKTPQDQEKQALEQRKNNQILLNWDPQNNPHPEQSNSDPLKSADINSLLQPLVYNNDLERTQANNVIQALSNSLESLNSNQSIINLSQEKPTVLAQKLGEKQYQEYLSMLRNYLAVQSVALNNLYQLYAERETIDPNKTDPNLRNALKAVAQKTQGALSLLKLENRMATHRLLDRNWHIGLIKDNPATLQRQQVELLAENLAESYHIRMTLERLVVTMSALLLEFNGQVRSQLKTQIQSMNNSEIS